MTKYCECWFYMGSGPNGECKNCGLIWIRKPDINIWMKPDEPDQGVVAPENITQSTGVPYLDIVNRLWHNWAVHNLIGHPLSEIVRWIMGSKAGEWVHDATMPPGVTMPPREKIGAPGTTDGRKPGDMPELVSKESYVAMNAVLMERFKQNEKWGLQQHDPEWWLPILGEEFGELCKAILENNFGPGPTSDILDEAVQCAAVSLAIVECMMRRLVKEEADS